MLPTLNVGPLVLPTTGIVYIIGAWFVLSVVERSAKLLNLDPESTYGLAAIALAAGFVGARLLFVVLHWTAYRENLIGIVWPLTSGYDQWGGLAIGALAGFFYGRAKHMPFAATLDALAPALLVALIVLSIADFTGGPGYGTETSLPWGLNVFGIRRHPVQIYEIVVALVALASWWRLLSRRTFDGQLFLIAAAIYAAGRLIFDAFRANAWLTTSGYHGLQIVSLVILLVSILILGRQATRIEVDSQIQQ